MNEKSLKESLVREKIIEAVRKDLLGPSSEKEIIYDRPNIQYLTGMLSPVLCVETDPDDHFLADKADLSEDAEQISDEDEGEVSKTPLVKSSSIGISFYLSNDVNKIKVTASWGEYSEHKDDNLQEDLLDLDDEPSIKKEKKSYHRIPHNDEIEIDLSNDSLQEYKCKSDEEIIVSFIKYKLKMEVH